MVNQEIEKSNLKIYAISGLGADSRVFNFLKLNYRIQPIEWIEPRKNETLQDYSIRLSSRIDTKSNYILLGVSFGGIVATEISKLLKPRLTILISSAEKNNEISPIFRLIGKTGLLKILPSICFSLPKFVALPLFGAKNKELLNKIIKDTDLKFTKWALNQLAIWDNQKKIENIFRIHGTNDRLIPWKSFNEGELIKKGEHFMIVDRANEISKIINEKIKNALQQWLL